jgi:hypothetical protein
MICSICGEEVSKRQSYALKDGTRACKKHDLIDKLPKPVYPKVKEKETDRHKKPWERVFTMRPCCFHCDKTGIMKQEWAYRNMIEMQKFEQRHGQVCNIFSEEYNEIIKAIRDHFGFLDYEEIAILERVFIGNMEPWKINQLIGYSHQPVVQMTGGLAILCDKCLTEFDLTPKLPDLTMKDLLLLGTLVKPYIDGIAKEELEKE